MAEIGIGQRLLARTAALVMLTLVVLATGCSVAVVPLESTASASTESTSPSDQRGRSETAALDSAPFDFPVSDEWPDSFRAYVDFVQETRGEEFETAADVRFADQAALVAEFQAEFFSFDDLDPESQEIVLRLDDMYRALGITNKEFNLLDAQQGVVGDIGAFYDWEVGEIVFPSDGGEALDQIPVTYRPLLVHELGHALQSGGRIEWAQGLEDPALQSMLLEGEAEWLFDQYLLSLTAAEWQAWSDSFPEEPESTSDLPEILQVEFGASYALGSRFFHARYATDGLAGIDAVFDGDPHGVTGQIILDPWRFTGRPVRMETFEYRPPKPQSLGAPVDIGYDFITSAVDWHQILGAAMPGDVALHAARGINSFSVPVGWTDDADRLCFSIEVSASFEQEAVVEQALRTWSEVDGFERWFKTTQRGYYVGGCDPGAGNVPTPRATPGEILVEVAVVIDTETWAVEQGLEPRAGFCAAWDVVNLFNDAADDDKDDVYYSWFEQLDPVQLTTDC